MILSTLTLFSANTTAIFANPIATTLTQNKLTEDVKNEIREMLSDSNISLEVQANLINGAKVHTKKGLIGMGFYIDYTNVDGLYDYISDVYDEFVTVIGGSTSEWLKVYVGDDDIWTSEN